MVFSRIDRNVSYIELKRIEKQDIGMECQVYITTLNGVEVPIAIGNVNNTYANVNISYFPIYLVKLNGKNVVQIGLYEIIANKYATYIVNNDLNVDMLGDPLLYSFATAEYLYKMRLVPPIFKEMIDMSAKENDFEEQLSEKNDDKKEETKKEINDTKIVIPRERQDLFKLIPNVVLPVLLEEETSAIDKDIKSKYQENVADKWISKYMKNPNYEITDNEGGGDCLFAVIRDAFSSIGQITTVDKLRTALADKATDETFQHYKSLYDGFHADYEVLKDKLQKQKETYSNLQKQYTSNVSTKSKQDIYAESIRVKGQIEETNEEFKLSKSLMNEMGIMKNVETLDQFKSKIKTCQFWADMWALSTLESTLNIKLILLSSEAFAEKDYNNVILCGDTSPDMGSEFVPEYYILVEYTGYHYKLMSYKRKQLFKFEELPFGLKKGIINTCMVNKNGVYNIIPNFVEMKEKEPKQTTSSSMNGGSSSKEKNISMLFDNDIQFVFYENANSKPNVGKGANEKIPKDRVIEFAVLNSIPNWRRKLADEYPATFSLDNHRWHSVEHYYQASKFRKTSPEFYLSFSLDSGTELSRDVNLAKYAGSKTGKTPTNTLLRPTNVQIDPEFYNGVKNKESLFNAQRAKFTQNEDFKKLLLATKNAKLLHFVPKREPELADSLIELREQLKRIK
jgi:predicted NAD-dependent protein-ADP-ribosyltransferase YbiA (DUF1768 family)